MGIINAQVLMLALLLALLAPPPTIQQRGPQNQSVTDAEVTVGMVKKGAAYYLQQNQRIAVKGYRADRVAIPVTRPMPDRAQIERRLVGIMVPGSLKMVPACDPQWGDAYGGFWTFIDATIADSKRCQDAPAYSPFFDEPSRSVLSRRIRIALVPGTRQWQVDALLAKHGLRQIERYPRSGPVVEVVGQTSNGCGLAVVRIAERVMRAPIVQSVTNDIVAFRCPG